MSADEGDFGSGPGSTIGRGHEDVGGIGDTPGADPEADAPTGPRTGAGTQRGPDNEVESGEAGLGGGEGDLGGGGDLGGDLGPLADDERRRSDTG